VASMKDMYLGIYHVTLIWWIPNMSRNFAIIQEIVGVRDRSAVRSPGTAARQAAGVYQGVSERDTAGPAAIAGLRIGALRG
jgi:hypothetical protein